MKVLIPITDGFDPIELTNIYSTLKKQGIVTKIVGLSSTIVESECGLKIIAGKRLMDSNTDDFDVLVLVSGKQTDIFLKSNEIKNLIHNFNKQGKIIIALSKMPILLADLGIINDKIATVYPGFEKRIPRPRNGKVVVDKNIITTNCQEASKLVALKLIETVKTR